MNLASGGVMTTTPVKNFKIIEDEARIENLRIAAEEYEQRETITPEEFDKILEDLIAKNFSKEEQARVQQFVDQFCSEGKGVMLGILDRAREAGKLDEAFQILEEDFREHWNYRPPPFRGSFVTEQDVYYVNRAYQKLGLPLPD